MGYKDTEVGRIPEEWEVLQIGEIGDVVGGGTPKTSIEEYWNGEISWITPKDLSGYTERYIYYGERSITKKGLENSSAKILPKGTILFSSRAPIGYLAIAGKELCTNQGFKSIVCDNKKVDIIFIYYLMMTKRDELENIAGGSTFKEVSGKTVKEFKVPIPPLQEQKAIAHILSTLDEKIEINNQINKKLEEMAQDIFKHWFVDFEFPNEDGEPYKSSGGEMVESELGLIPKGWEVVKLDEIVQISTESVSPNKYDKQIFEHYSIPALDERRFPIFELGREIKSNKYKVYSNSILISKLNPTIKRIWRPLCLTENSVCSTEFINYIPINDEIKEFCYEVINSERFLSFLINHATGSTGSRQRVKPLDTLSYKFAKPMDIELLIKYSKITKELYEIIDDKILENQKIIQLRDTLLPKLMSGEIRVPLDDENDIS